MDMNSIVVREDILKTMSVVLIVSANLVSSTPTVLQENLVVVVLINVTQVVLENHVLMMVIVLQEKPVVITNVDQAVVDVVQLAGLLLSLLSAFSLSSSYLSELLYFVVFVLPVLHHLGDDLVKL